MVRLRMPDSLQNARRSMVRPDVGAAGGSGRRHGARATAPRSAAQPRTTDSSNASMDDPRTRVRSYATVMSLYTLLVGSATLVARRRQVQLPPRLDLRDLGLAALATQRVATLITKDPVMTPLRAPFTEFEEVSGPAELKERARDDSKLRHTAGELLTCPFCMGQWIGTAFVGGLIVAPRQTRVVIAAFSIVGAANWLQLAHGRLAPH